MEHFPSGIRFKYPWRKYQKRILDELAQHLEDDHLHLVAPPGSGKTVLGLEVALRLNRPTLIVAPTLAIRNQWIHRFCELFLSTTEKPQWISRNIHKPKFVTVVTYQALHMASGDDAAVAEKLKKAGIKTIVVDEAHHLQNAWWQSLNEIKKALQPTIVGLTATPPYDVSRAEWQRYIDINGPVDAEITVPELVVEGDLCPHQDYVISSMPTAREHEKILRHQQRMVSLFNEIRQDATLIVALSQHPLFTQPLENLDAVYSNILFYSSILIFLHQAGVEISQAHLEVVGDKKLKIPGLTIEWMETLLCHILFKEKENLAGFEEHIEKLRHKLATAGVLENCSVNLKTNKKISRLLSSSITKLNSILDIVRFEYDQLHTGLRMVILTDYIRKEFYLNQAENTLELNKIGVMPIFEQLRRNTDRDIKLGVLTGSLIIIPVSALEVFNQIAGKFNTSQIFSSPLPYDERYRVITGGEKIKHALVYIVTEVFQRGGIEVLVGTKALLGEGWDAPAINSLILASFVGSYVQSNQMRGRAIRTNKAEQNKTGNIWHLICIDPTAVDGGEDIQLLKRRFKTFVGVSLDGEESIENGINRLGLPPRMRESEQITGYNRKVFECAGQRDRLKQRWHAALAKGLSLVEEYKIPYPEGEDYRRNRRMCYSKTIAWLVATLTSGLSAFAWMFTEWLGKNLGRIRNLDDLITVTATAGVIGLFLFGGQFVDALRLSLKYRDISRDVKKIGEALLATLQHIGIVHTEEVAVVAEVDDQGNIYSFLDGGSTYERSVFIKSLQEIIGPIDNPRYIVVRKSVLLKLIFQRDYHSVPEVIGCKKRFAETFTSQWENNVGRCELIYTRTLEGRKALLKARMHSLASEFEDKSERINKWR